jgi:aspartyl-tRNA(Asn)/glutamyl-tRNA(Gln) amidotransferase subunit C
VIAGRQLPTANCPLLTIFAAWKSTTLSLPNSPVYPNCSSAMRRKRRSNDLQQMIGFVEKLNELNLEGVSPLLHMSESVNVLREDEVKGSVSREEAMKNAPQHNEEFFMVPKVIKKF